MTPIIENLKFVFLKVLILSIKTSIYGYEMKVNIGNA